MSQDTSRTGAFSGNFDISRMLAPQAEHLPEAMESFFRFGAKMQSEWMTLCGKRAEAWLDWPGKLAGCKTAGDLAEAQGEFLKTAQQDYSAWSEAVLHDALIEPEELDEAEQTADAPEAKAKEPEASRQAPAQLRDAAA